MNWEEVKQQIAPISDHYSMREDQHKLLFEYAMQVPKGGTVLEIGVCNGKTAALFALVAKHKSINYYGIDDFSLEGSRADVLKHFKRLKLSGEIIEGRSEDVEWNRPIDLLFIDGGHDEANVRVDCEKFVPLVKPAGIVIFDDWAVDESKANPHWAVGHYGTIATKGWESLENDISLRVFRK